MVEADGKNGDLSQNDYWPMLLDYSESYSRKVLRNLELKAYAMVVTALRAQGPLTESKQSALKELRKLLSITIERHKAEVRRAVNDEELATICDWICGYSVDEDWVLEGRRVVDVRTRPVPHTAYTERANYISERHAKANNHLLSPAQTGNLERTFMPPAPQPKSTTRKQSHPRTVSSNLNSSAPSGPLPIQSPNQMPIVSKSNAATVVLNESSTNQSNISQLEYSMMISENTSVNRSSHDSGGVVIETLAADIPQGDLIVDSFAEPIPTSANVKQGQSALQPIIDMWSPDSSRPVNIQNQNIVLLGRPPQNQDRDTDHVIKVSSQSIQNINPHITEVKSLHGMVQHQVRPLAPQISTTRFFNASRVRPIVAASVSQTQAQQPDRPKFTVSPAVSSAIRKSGTGSLIVVPSKGSGKTVVTSGSFQPVKIVSGSISGAAPISSVSTIDKPVTARSFSVPAMTKQHSNIQRPMLSQIYEKVSAPVDLDSDDVIIQTPTSSTNKETNVVRQIQSLSGGTSLSFSVSGGQQHIISKPTQLCQETVDTFSVADKRVRPIDPPSNWVQMALGFLNRYCIAWSEQTEVTALANDFTKVMHNLIGGMYPSIREMDADIRNIRLRSLGGARDNPLLIKKIEDIFNSYDQDYRNLVERLDKISGQQSKRPRYN